MFWEKRVLRDFTKFTGKHLLTIKTPERRFGVFIVNYETCNFIKKETLAQVFSCEFCEISKDTFFHRTALVAASEPTIF